ncbi:unnamed protein product [Heterotrigona itama]|uniref:Uncharacterized protein n=1 Tax=Heterotrigona itama TaxID=395501 RepID=A0A6V7HAJ4_9HYME|nr:unnamed protein product [Heterotrigona itama]
MDLPRFFRTSSRREINTGGSSKKLVIPSTSYTETSSQISSANTSQKHETKHGRISLQTSRRRTTHFDRLSKLLAPKAESLAVNFEKVYNSTWNTTSSSIEHKIEGLANHKLIDDSLNCIP